MTNDRNKNVPLVVQFVGYTSPERTYVPYVHRRLKIYPLFALLFAMGSTICNVPCEIIALSCATPLAVIALIWRKR